jgi:hypothetical protein
MSVRETRKEKRFPGVLPVGISSCEENGETTHCLAHTLNLSLRGACLAGVSVPVRVGRTVQIIRGRMSADFKIIWVAPNSQIGVESIEAGSLWGLDRWKPDPQNDERGSR